jgi:hypothetical protein
MDSSNTAGNCKDNTINYYFIGNNEDLKNETIFKYFDTNYIPLTNILSSYYQTMGSKTPDDELNILLDKLNNNRKVYNNYNIYPIFVSILIIIILLTLFILRFIFLQYYYLYTYILLGIILILIIIGSIWFVYINNETL